MNKRITKDTKPHPANFYGDSKWRADKGVGKLALDTFNVTVLCSPMIFGNGWQVLGRERLLNRELLLILVFG